MPTPRRATPALVLLLLVALSSQAPGHIPRTESYVDDWFESLIAPDTGIPCCDRLDCHEVASRRGAVGWEAWSGGKWIAVPEEKVITDTVNPVEQAVLCVSPTLGLRCFVPPPTGFRRNRGS